MASRIIPGISLHAFWALGESGWKAGMDENIWRLSFMVQARVNGVIEELPLTPENGDRYILVDSGSPFNNYMAIRDVDIWAYIEPEHGFIIFNNENGHLLRYNSTVNQWVELVSPEAIKELYEANDDTNAFTNAEKNKLAGIENNATADMSAAEIKAAYESNLNTNAFTDAEKEKLNGLSSSRFLGVYPTLSGLQAAHPAPPAGSFAYVDSGPTADIMSYIWDANSVKYVPQASGNTQETPESIKEKYELNDDTNAFTDADKSKLDLIEAGATADLSGSEIKVLYEAEPDTNAFTDAEKAKLASLESSLFVGTYTSVLALETAHPTASIGAYAYVDAGIGQDVALYIWDNDDTVWIQSISGVAAETPSSVKSKYESNPDTNAFTDADKTKLDSLGGIFVDTVETSGRALTNTDFSGNRMLSINSATAVTLTIPTGLTGKEPLLIYQMGAGQVTIGGAATLRNRNGLKTAGQYAVLSIIPRGSNIYVISGDVTT